MPVVGARKTGVAAPVGGIGDGRAGIASRLNPVLGLTSGVAGLQRQSVANWLLSGQKTARVVAVGDALDELDRVRAEVGAHVAGDRPAIVEHAPARHQIVFNHDRPAPWPVLLDPDGH